MLQLLYELSRGIAVIKSRQELLELIVEKVQPVFGFNDRIDLYVLDADGGRSDFFPKPATPVKGRGDGGEGSTLSGELQTAFGTIGTFTVYFEENKAFSDEELELFKTISGLIAIAVENILANEDFIAREAENSILLSISEAVATLRDKKKLLKFVFETVKPIFNFYDSGFFVFSRDKEIIEDWTVSMPEISPSLTNYTNYENNVASFPFKTSALKVFYDQLREAQKPMMVYYTQELFDRYPDYPQWEGIKAGGYKESMGCLLRAEQDDLGILFFNSVKENHFNESNFSLFQGIADQLATAVANILSNEEILEREREKAQLLKISEAIATIQNYKELLQVIYEVIQPAFPFDNTGIFIEDKPGESIFEITDSEVLSKTISGMFTEAKIFGPFSLKDFDKQSWYYTEKPVITTLEKEIRYVSDPVCVRQFKTGMAAGLKDIIGGPLMTGGRKIGAIYLNTKIRGQYSEKNIGLFKSLTDLIAIAVANIVANLDVVQKAEEIARLNKQLKAQNDYLIEEVEQQYNFEEMIGQNAAFKAACKNIGLVAKTDSSVLILGETGTGKEMVARAIHNNSPRKGKPLIKVNCAALPANLIESELFGHERGAFTGAVERRIGKFELANNSTLFLDEVGEMQLELQSKLLRTLQEKEIERIGSNRVIPVDVRIIAATNRDLYKDVQAGRFRQDLYYRLHIFPIALPALRERKEDIPLLAAHFLQKYASKMGKKITGFGTKAIEDMMSYDWPGNIRELEHVIERAVIVNSARILPDLELPHISRQKFVTAPAQFVIKTWEELERDYILEILKITKGNVSGAGGAAELLQLPRSTLQSKMKKLGIKRKHYVEGKG